MRKLFTDTNDWSYTVRTVWGGITKYKAVIIWKRRENGSWVVIENYSVIPKEVRKQAKELEKSDD